MRWSLRSNLISPFGTPQREECSHTGIQRTIVSITGVERLMRYFTLHNGSSTELVCHHLNHQVRFAPGANPAEREIDGAHRRRAINAARGKGGVGGDLPVSLWYTFQDFGSKI